VRAIEVRLHERGVRIEHHVRDHGDAILILVQRSEVRGQHLGQHRKITAGV